MNIAHAVDAKAIAGPFIARIQDAILFPLISLLLGIALLVFLWGVFEYIRNAGVESGDARTAGKKHMLFGIIGLVVMVSAFAILKIAANTFGISVP